ncbi:hypothetical protein BDV29DRAFT_163164 [Aspergillus leporis]|uniref:Acid phosphatase protein n=1 Tax=Aspergillus leporis TaxID=41062 RepID=A0A5N5WK96_9EURO|nr:hypothetical protein BDV29DRAFT_163164 [Aspergillus leporis]
MVAQYNNPKSSRYGPTEVSEVFEISLGSTSVEYKRHAMYAPSEWLYEIASSVLSLGITITIACIFWYMDNKPMSDWSGPISLSATIAILTTAYSAAVMHGVSQFIGQLKWRCFKVGPQKLSNFEVFDAATRGVWGSILLLTTLKWNLATIGALITILRLTYAPFTQQVVLLEERDIVSPDPSAAFGYSHQYYRELVGGMSNSRFGSVPQDPNMQSAIVQALYGTNATTTPFNCPGACRWPGSYLTLSFKSNCKNVTQETLRSEHCNGTQYQARCNMTTPGRLLLSTRYDFTEYGTSHVMNATSMLNSFGEALPDTFPEITRFAIYRSTPDHNYQPENINITECSLSLSSSHLNGAKANGSDFSFETVQEIDFSHGDIPWQFTTDDGLSGYLYTNQSQVGTINVPPLKIGYTDIVALENFLTSPTIVTEWVEGNFENENVGLTAALTGDIDINERFNSMASRMTDYLRNGPNAQLGLGERVRSVAFIVIRWPYYALPVLTEVLAIVFTVSTVLSNRGCHIPLWKSLALAALACQHDRHLRVLQSTVKDIEELQKAAGKTAARLQ